MLIEDGAYAALPGTSIEKLMKKALETHPIFAIQADLKARGVDKIIDGIQVCDYSCFVTLSEEHLTYSWL
jgi:sulfur relay protein TusB/DsrH